MTSTRFSFVGTVAPLALLLAVSLAPVETTIGAGLGAWLVIIRFVTAPDGRGL